MEPPPSLRTILALGVLIFLPLVNSWPTSDRTPDLHNTTLADDVSFLLYDPWPARVGLEPHYGGQRTLWLRKRECLENGSNYCFAEKDGFCPDCGGCCSLGADRWCCQDATATCCPGKACCSAGATCCGTGCCEKGRKCTDGKCELPV